MSASAAIKPAANPRRRRWIKNTAAISAALCPVLLAAFALWIISLGPLPLVQARQVSTTIVDRNG